MRLTVDQALESLRTPKPNYDAATAHIRFAFNKHRAWNEAVTAAEKKNAGPKPVAKLVALVGDVAAPHSAEGGCSEQNDSGRL